MKGTKFFTSYNDLGQQTVKYKPWHGSKVYVQGTISEYNEYISNHENENIARARLNRNVEGVRPNTVLQEMDTDFSEDNDEGFNSNGWFDAHEIHSEPEQDAFRRQPMGEPNARNEDRNRARFNREPKRAQATQEAEADENRYRRRKTRVNVKGTKRKKTQNEEAGRDDGKKRESRERNLKRKRDNKAAPPNKKAKMTSEFEVEQVTKRKKDRSTKEKLKPRPMPRAVSPEIGSKRKAV
jgi:hypothetical protein